jgi:hypothetical protein
MRWETASAVAAGLPAQSVGVLHLAMGFEHGLYAPLQLRKLLHAYWGKMKPGASHPETAGGCSRSGIPSFGLCTPARPGPPGGAWQWVLCRRPSLI